MIARSILSMMLVLLFLKRRGGLGIVNSNIDTYVANGLHMYNRYMQK